MTLFLVLYLPALAGLLAVAGALSYRLTIAPGKLARPPWDRNRTRPVRAMEGGMSAPRP